VNSLVTILMPMQIKENMAERYLLFTYIPQPLKTGGHFGRI